MRDNSGDSDLRSSGTPPPSQDQESSGGGWTPPPFRTVVEDRGITLYRAVAKLIDYFTLSIAINIITAPIMFIMFFANASRFEELSNEADPDVFPWEFFALLLLMWGVVMALILALEIAYFFILEKKFQQTLGKKAFDLKVIDVSKERAGTGQLFARAVLYTLSLMLYFWIVELIVALVRDDGRSVTDLICGTTVIREKKVYYYQETRQSL